MRQHVSKRCNNLNSIRNGSFFTSSGFVSVITAVLVLALLHNDDSSTRAAAAFSLTGRTTTTTTVASRTRRSDSFRVLVSVKETERSFSINMKRKRGRHADVLKLFEGGNDNDEDNHSKSIENDIQSQPTIEQNGMGTTDQKEERRNNVDESNNNNKNPTNLSNRNNRFFFLPTINNPVDRIQDVQLLLFDVFLILNLTLSASFWVVYRLDVLKTMTIALNEGCIFASCWIISGIINNAFGGEDANDESSSSSSSSSDDLFTPKDPLLSKAISTFVMASILRLGLALLAFAMASSAGTAGIEPNTIDTTTIFPTADSLMSVVNQATESPTLTFQTTSTTTSSSPAMMLSEIGGLRDDQAAKLVPLELGVGAVLMTTWRMLHAQIKRY